MNDIYSWHQETWRVLRQDNASLGHALLLKGRQGVGKLVFARQLAKSLLCEHPSIGGEACRNCQGCRWFEQGGHPDFRLILPEAMAEKKGTSAAVANEENTGVETGAEMESLGTGESGSPKSKRKPSKQIRITQIRDITEFINMSSHQNGHKVVLIYPAETMNPEAANALLKNLEEPPPRTLFILVTHRVQYLLPTLRSRCCQIAMPAPDPATATAWLKEQGVRDPATCLASAGYAPLAALEFNDVIYLERHRAFISQISLPGKFNPSVLAEEMQKSDLPTLVTWLQKWCYDLMSFRTTGKIRYHLDMLAPIKSLASRINPRALATFLRVLNETLRLAHHPLNARLFLEEMLFSYVMSVAPQEPTH